MPSRPYLRLVRLSDNGQQTESILELYRSKAAKSPVARFPLIEPPWKNNAPRVSCIPAGSYALEHRTSEKYGKHLWVRGCEPARQLVLIHTGNTVRDTAGCLLPGLAFADVDKDGDLDVSQSKPAMAAVLAFVPDIAGADADLDIVSTFHR